MPSKEYRAFLDAVKGRLVDVGDSTEVARAKLEAMHGHPIKPSTRVDWIESGPVRRAMIVAEEAKDTERILVLFHGGAFIAAGGDGYLFYAEALSKYCDARLLLIDYRLAPENPYPAALDDCVGGYLALLASGVAPARVGFIGDSCGGGLVLSSLIRLRDQGQPLPACGVSLGGWFDLEAQGEAGLKPLGRDPFAHPEFIRARGRDYVGEAGDLRDPFVSPIHANPKGLPPLLLQVGQVDLVRDDALDFGKSAALAGVDVTLEIHPEMVHGFQGLASAGIPEAIAALARVRNFVARAIA
ncbi:MAG TPA: alpha/beta hydrolase [Myxococcales bacterium]|nr:alpha/beta hydrolase [Myxococcales bacterium]HIK84878.1 alpha/beta hydrolase [Myxococcales bacterium]